jgi:hypothetical protein
MVVVMKWRKRWARLGRFWGDFICDARATRRGQVTFGLRHEINIDDAW